jgi:hypothetical protein
MENLWSPTNDRWPALDCPVAGTMFGLVALNMTVRSMGAVVAGIKPADST